MRNKKKRKNLIILWTFLTSLLLTASSYAWFSTNVVLGFHSFNIQIASKGGIEMSTDAVNWKGVLTLVDLIEARNNYPNSLNQVPYSLVPVSSAGAIENGLLKLYDGELSQDSSMNSILIANRTIEEEGFGLDSAGKFVTFDVFLKNISAKTLYLTPSSSIEHIGDVSTGIENAFRVAFLHQGTMSETASRTSIQNQRGADRAYIWEPNYDVHTQFGVDHAKNVYNINTTMTNGNLLPYHGIIDTITREEGIVTSNANSIFYPTKFKQVEVDIPTRKEFSSFEEIFVINPGITKVRIYIWIEGQDVDCEDNASVGDVLINLQMSTEDMQ